MAWRGEPTWTKRYAPARMPIHSGHTLVALQVPNEERGKTRDLGTVVPFGVPLLVRFTWTRVSSTIWGPHRNGSHECTGAVNRSGGQPSSRGPCAPEPRFLNLRAHAHVAPSCRVGTRTLQSVLPVQVTFLGWVKRANARFLDSPSSQGRVSEGRLTAPSIRSAFPAVVAEPVKIRESQCPLGLRQPA